MRFVFDLQRFATSSNLGTLKNLGAIITTLGLKKLAKDFEKAKDDPVKYLKNNANPILNFIATTPFGKKFGNYATLITRSILIIDNTLSVLTDKTLSDETRTSKLGLIAGDLEAMALATNKLSNSFKKKNLWFLSIFSAGISLTANLIAASDGLDLNEKKKINKSYVTFLKSLGSDLVKEIFDAAVEQQLHRAFTEDLTTDLVEEIMTKGKFFKNASKTLTKTFGVVLSFATGVLNAIDEHKVRMEKYTDDGIPENIAKHDAFIDALATFIHDTWSGYVKGVDDWIFNFMLGFTDVETDKNYMEIIADRFKTLNYKNSGSSDDDSILISAENKSYIYGDNGNDSIKNVASDVSIWGGQDNDTIWSISDGTKIPVRNSIFGGSGNDFIYIEDKNSTIYGGKGADSVIALGTRNIVYGDAGNDTLLSQGTKNVIYGDAGDDYIFLLASTTGNSISGGTGDDFIVMQDEAKNTLIKYSSGDGNDTISGFGANDSLTINGKYSTVKSDSDFKIKVGSGSILLLGAADKKIHINNNVFNDDSSGSGTFTPIEFPSLPAVPEYILVSGTSGDDYIYNHRSNVLINAGAGDDHIDNYEGYNYKGGDNVKILGGKGNDSIVNSSSNVSIFGGDDDDTINNSGDNIIITGDKGNDSISNGYHPWFDTWISGGDSICINGGDGNDTVFGGSSYDTLQIGGGSGTYSTETNGSDIIVTVGKGKITLEGAARLGSNINIDGIYNDPTLLTVTNSTKSPVTVSSVVKTVDASSRTKAVEITGNGKANTISGGSKNDSLYGGKGHDSLVGNSGNDKLFGDTGNDTLFGGAGKDTLSGDSGNDIIFGEAGNDCLIGGKGNDTLTDGKGNDSLWGDAGADTFIYASGDGKDIIFGFDNKDTLTLDGLDFKASYKNDILTLKVSGGSITLKDFSATTFHINSDIYHINSKNKFVKK